MAKLIEKTGEYLVEIREPYWEEAGKSGQTGLALILPGFCDIDGEEHTINGRLYFTSTLIAGGRNRGKPLYEVAAETCEQIGMSKPFSPEKREELNGKYAKFVVEEEEYEGKTRIRVAFVNPPGREHLADAEAKKIWSVMTDGASPAASQQAEAGKEDDDDIPF